MNNLLPIQIEGFDNLKDNRSKLTSGRQSRCHIFIGVNTGSPIDESESELFFVFPLFFDHQIVGGKMEEGGWRPEKDVLVDGSCSTRAGKTNTATELEHGRGPDFAEGVAFSSRMWKSFSLTKPNRVII